MRDILSLTGLFYRSDDDYDEAIGTLLSIGASVLKVAGEKILEYYNSSEEMFNNFTIKMLHISGELSLREFRGGDRIVKHC